MENRIISLDLVRGLTIIFMIVYHIFIYWGQINTPLIGSFILYLGLVAAPLFIIISGFSFFIFIDKKKKMNLTKAAMFIEVLKRAVFIFTVSTLFQVVFSVFFQMPAYGILYWSVFQLIAFGMVLSFFILMLPQLHRFIVYIILIFVFYLLAFIIRAFEIRFLYFIATGLFPFLPWVNIFLIGMIFSEITLYTQVFKNIKFLFYTFIIALGFFLLWVVIRDYYIILEINFVLYGVSVFLMFFTLFYYIFDIKQLESDLEKIISNWGKLSFSIYYIQFGVIGVGLLVFPLLLNGFTTNKFLFYQYLIIIVVFFIGLEIFIRLWKKYNYILGIEWFMNKISTKSLFKEERS